MNVILIEKDGTIGEKNIKTLDKLYSICGYRSNKDFEKLYEWEHNTSAGSSIYELYGKKNGKQDKENTYVFPEIKEEKYFGTLCLIKYNGSITLDEWNDFVSDEIEDSDTNRDSVSFEKNITFEEELTYEEYEQEN